MAENVRSAPGIKTGKDYLYQVKSQLNSGRMRIEFPNPEYSAKLGGVDFAVLPSELTIGNTTVKQKYYVTVMKGYALSFIASYKSDDDEASLQKIMDSVTFKTAGQ